MSRAGFALGLLILLPWPASAAAPPPRVQWIAVVAPDFAAAIAPLVKERAKQGMRVMVVKTTDVLTQKQILSGDSTLLRDRVRAHCRAHVGESHVLLVGAIDSLFVNRIVPPCIGTTSRMKGQPTDAPYGCPDGGSLPTVAVGRFPARNADEAESMVAKTLALEKSGRAPGAWKRRITVLAGIPAYNPLVDRLVESLAMSRFDRIHPMWFGRAVYTNPLSRFCLPTKELRTKTLDYLREGQAFTLYLGHSNAQTLYGGPNVTFLDREDWGQAELPHGGGVFVTFGCNGCQLKGDDGEGYGLWAMRNGRGPATVIGSHGVCFAAMVNLAADGLFRRAFQTTTPDRLAPAWLALLESVSKDRLDWITYRALDAVDGDSRIPQWTQRQEHLEMFVLLGDPALRLPTVEDVSFEVPDSVVPGERLKVRGTLPEGMTEARVEVSLERLPGSLPGGLVVVPRQPGLARDRAMLANHEKSNRFALVTETIAVRGKSFEVTLKVPPELSGASCIVRVRAETKVRDAMSARRIPVRPAQ
jgi:hypothetical protein